jgi:hypothetical protein
MVRIWRLLAQFALVGALTLAFPSAGSALSAVIITLTPSGPSPSVVTLDVGEAGFLVWVNPDTVTHTVTFADGLCSFHVAPGGSGQCPAIQWQVGQYPYTMDGTLQASIVLEKHTPAARTVTLTAKSHTIKRGAHLRLHGSLDYAGTAGPPSFFTAMHVIVLRRHDRHHPFRAFYAVHPGRRHSIVAGFPWKLRVHPRRTTIYIAEVNTQPPGEEWWQNAMSKPFKVVVRGRK